MRVLHDWLLTPERVAVHLPTRVAVVADLHLGYAEARRRQGEAVPSESVFDLLEPICRVRQSHGVQRLVIAGDLLEDGSCREALAAFLEWRDSRKMDLIAVVPGNHDLGLEAFAAAKIDLPIATEGISLAGWRIVHGEGVLPDAPMVSGHIHPWVRWSPRSRANRPRFTRSRFASNSIDGPCYLSGPQRLILPAFSKEAAGVDVLSKRQWRNWRCHVVAGGQVFDLGEVSTLRQRLSQAFQSRARSVAE